MSLPNLQDALKNIPDSFFMWSRWSSLRDYKIEDEHSVLSTENTSVKDMCALVESVYIALGYGKSDKIFCSKAETSEYLIIHSFLEALTDNGKLSLVRNLDYKFQVLNIHVIDLLKEQLASISVSTSCRGIPGNTPLRYKASSVAGIGLFSNSNSKSIIESPLADFECPISNEVMRDPVTAPDGNMYDRVSLQQWYDKGKRTCPLNPAKILTNPADLPTTYLIKKLITEKTELESQNKLGLR